MQTVTGSWDPVAGWQPPVEQFAAGASEGGRRTLILFFADRQTSPDMVAELEAVLPNAVCVGCSTAGQILGAEVAEAPVVAIAVHFDTVIPRVAWADLSERATSIQLGELVAQRLDPEDLPRRPGTVLILGDGSDLNGTALVDGVRSVLPAHIGLSGGLAGDGDRFERTWVYAGGRAREGAAVAVALVGAGLRVGYGSEGGWDGFGPWRRVTASTGNVLRTLDDRPALALYREYLGDRAAELPASALHFPLLIRSPDESVDLVRTVLSVDDADASMTFAGDVPTGWSARLMRTSADRLVDAASVAAEVAVAATAEPPGPAGPRVAIAVSCIGRRLVLGQQTDEEVEAVADVLGPDTSLIGFYSYGEVTQKGVFCDLHNQTMTLTTITDG